MAVTSALATDSAARAGLSRDQLLELYYWMRLTRSLEERLVNLYRQTKVVGGLFRSLGQEACAVGSAYALGREDVLSPLIRNLGSMLVKGATPARGPAAVHGQGRFAHPRPRAQHPFRRPRGPELRRPDLAPGRHGAGHGRRHAHLQDAEGAARRAGVRGRRRHLHRRVPRGHQLRRGPALPAGRDRREQPLRLLHAHRRSSAPPSGWPTRRRATASPASGPTATTSSPRTR